MQSAWYDGKMRRVRDLSCGDARVLLELEIRRPASKFTPMPITVRSMTKDILARVAIAVLRPYVRYFPIRAGKKWVFETIVRPYLSWRSFRFRPICLTRNRARMELRLPDLVQSQIFFFGIWEPHITAFINDRLSAGSMFVDVGANVGYYTLLAAQIVGDHGHVFAIEASPSIFRQLQRNLDLNAFQKLHNVTLYNVAVSDSEGTLKVFLNDDSNLGASSTIPLIAHTRDQRFEAEVPARTLSAIVGRERLLNARMIKIDVEGAEALVIRGILDLLGSFSERTEWIFEVTFCAAIDEGSSVANLLDGFRDAGYNLYRILSDSSVLDSYLAGECTYVLAELSDFYKNDAIDVVASKAILLRTPDMV